MARAARTYKTLNKRRTLFGVDPGLFQLLVLVSLVQLNILHSLLAAVLLFLAGLLPARAITLKDPQMLSILLAGGRFRRRYDPFKRRDKPVGFVGEATADA